MKAQIIKESARSEGVGPSRAQNSNRLPGLQDAIRAAHTAAIGAAQTVVERARNAGLHLIEAKALLGHGEWLPWLKETGVSPRTAQKYMRLARHNPDITAAAAHLTIDGALDAIATTATNDDLIELFVIWYNELPRELQDEFLSRIGAKRIPAANLTQFADGAPSESI